MGWLTGWTYRKPIVITNTDVLLTNYQYFTEMNTAALVAAGKLRADCGDIRFTGADGTTILPHTLDWGANSATTRLTVKVPSIPAGESTIYLYYGNPSVAHDNTTDGDLVWEWFDDRILWTGGLDRYSGNPILSKTGSGWEKDVVYVPRIIKNADGTAYQDGSGKYWAFYAGGAVQSSGSQDQTGLMWSTDLITWTRYGSNPVMPVVPATYYAADHVVITAVYDPDTATFHAFFEANRDNPPATDFVTIGHASASVVTGPWTCDVSPILSQGSADDSLDLYACAVLKDGAVWRMLYTGHNAGGQYNMMYATAPAPEGPWTRYSNNYVWTNAANYISPSEFWKEGSTYYITYFASDEFVNLASAPAPEGPWTRDGALLVTQIDQFDSYWCFWPSQALVGGTWYTLFSGSDGTNGAIGLATSANRRELLQARAEKTWTNTYGTLTKSHGKLEYLPKSGYFSSARSGYSPAAGGSWRILCKAQVLVDEINTNLMVGQCGTDNAGGANPWALTGQRYGAANARLSTYTTSLSDSSVGAIAYNSWYNTTRIIELVKRSGYAKTIWRDTAGALLGEVETSAQVPNLANPLGLYGAAYASTHKIRIYSFAVGQYATVEPTYEIGPEESQGGRSYYQTLLRRHAA
ncbi:MAG: DUF2341 domain-containing protein [Anaerolineaceae bacterium]|nr:MAG: DUF2341 domain-containing protein [Anaerolineaceae bacterium]